MFDQSLMPTYGASGLAGVLPAVARSLGVAEPDGERMDLLDVLPARRAVVVLVDGLGYDLLRQRSGHAPFLRGLLPAAYRLSAGSPSASALIRSPMSSVVTVPS